MADNKINSFIENINTVANATYAASGDIIEDAENARDSAAVSANEAEASATNASVSEDKAQEWAEKSYNNPVETDKYSSFHWSEIAKSNSGDVVINDLTVSHLQTWSSEKLSTAINGKSESIHNHDGIYEPVFTKNTAFNKNLGSTGSSQNVSRDDHSHIEYEPAITPKGSAFNKSFGTTSGTVSEGIHNHSGMYMPNVTPKTAYNSDFGTVAGTVPQGNHKHTSSDISYDNTDNTIITSGNVQGAVGQLDAYLGVLSVSENSYMTAGSSTQYERTIAGASTPVPILMGLASLSSKNATLTEGASINVLIDPEPDKLIEGTLTITITLSSVDTVALSLALNGVTQGESINGTGTLTISKYLTSMPSDGFKLTPFVSNLDNTNNIFIESMAISWEGTPQGALVASGTSVNHSDLTGTGAANGVHTIDDIQGLQTEIDTKADKPLSITAGNFTLMDAHGNLTDSGVASGFESGLVEKINPATLDNIVVQQSDGHVKDGGKAISDLALKNGTTTEVFNVGVAVNDEHAIRKKTFDDTVATLSTTANLDAHIALVNPHGTTASDVGAAESTHTHAQSEVTGLDDALLTKYTAVAGATQDNLVVFDTAGTVKDSGTTVADLDSSDKVKKSGDTMAGNLFFPTGSAVSLSFEGGQVAYTYGGHLTGGNDNYSLSQHNNVTIQTWYGFSVAPTAAGYSVPHGESAFSVNARTGDIYAYKDYYANGHKVWHAGNDGAGSGLDADKLDGQSSETFIRDLNTIITGEDWNTLTNAGTYQTNGFSGVNGPPGGGKFGFLVVYRAMDSVRQEYTPDSGGIYIRVRWYLNEWSLWQTYNPS